MMVTALLMNKRPRAEFILVGPTQEVADLAFQQAAGMIDADPDGYLQKRFQVQEHIKTIVDRRNKAKLKVKTFDLKVKGFHLELRLVAAIDDGLDMLLDLEPLL